MIAGQGTVALELVEDAGPLDVLVVCVGGGGLIAGCALAATATGSTRVVGVEPAAGDDVRRSLQAGERVTIPVPRTIADGQQTTSPGELNFPIIQRLVDQVVTVTDEEIVAAIRSLAGTMKLLVEPTGCLGVAALSQLSLSGKRVGVLLSGGNVDLARYGRLLVGDAR